MIRKSWNLTTPYVHGICEKTKQLKIRPMGGFAKQMPVTVGDALLIEWAAPSNIVAVCVLNQLISGTPGTQASPGQVRARLQNIMKGLENIAITQKNFNHLGAWLFALGRHSTCQTPRRTPGTTR